MDNYEFPDYAPRWKDEIEGDDEDGWFWDESKATALPPNEIVDEEQGIEWHHVVEGLRKLKTLKCYSGPFTNSEIAQAITEVIVDETLASLLDKGLIEYSDGENFQLTDLGSKIAKDIVEENNGGSSNGKASLL